MGAFLAMSSSIKTLVKAPILAGLAALMLAGCGNDANRGNMTEMLKSSLPFLGKKTAAAPQPMNIPQVLANTTAPLTLIVQKDLNNTSVLVLQIEQNGAYRTYSTAGKQTLTFRQGLVTATRGLGNDMMSASVSESLALIRARKSGTAKRVLRYLDGANNVIAFEFNCQMFVTGSGQVRQGVVSANTVELTENCVADSRKFTNTYQVDASGMILSSRQWIAPLQGYYDIKVLRR